MKKTYLIGIMVIAMAILATGALAQMSITDIDYEVNGKSESGTPDLKPGDELEIDIEITNDDDTLDLEDVQITVTIEGIDDGDDLEEEDEISTIRNGKDKRTKLTFSIPWEAEEDTYDIVILVEGELENGTDVVVETTETLEIEKDKHEVVIRNAFFDTETLSCNRNARLSVTLVNIGQEDEEVGIEVTSLLLDQTLTASFDLDADASEDSRITKTFQLAVDDNTRAGTYPVNVKVTYDEGDESESDTVDLIIEDCESMMEEEEEETGQGQTDTPATQEPDTPVVDTPTTTTETTTVQPIFYAKSEKTFWEKYGMVTVLAIVAGILIILIIIMLLVLNRR